jgi:hypothetical protein
LGAVVASGAAFAFAAGFVAAFTVAFAATTFAVVFGGVFAAGFGVAFPFDFSAGLATAFTGTAFFGATIFGVDFLTGVAVFCGSFDEAAFFARAFVAAGFGADLGAGFTRDLATAGLAANFAAGFVTPFAVATGFAAGAGFFAVIVGPPSLLSSRRRPSAADPRPFALHQDHALVP